MTEDDLSGPVVKEIKRSDGRQAAHRIVSMCEFEGRLYLATERQVFVKRPGPNFQDEFYPLTFVD